ncbi:MAG: Kae1-associated serine/threonine protein kinase [Thermoplasmata archaeon YP2-bin.285]|uniref:non-specific serine/threonine protein kinase n=1 Tax=Candidatus Sysuiplasma superficiale TaxID=2823368 RepID=A0A8J7YPG0_9ARCH|nr:Kae1-associated serine/threonine protein kinase [Candidatus Sysuiplasma superficiale]
MDEIELKRGAEALVVLSSFLGRAAVYKRRLPKSYRDRRLDRRLIVQRIRNEARCIIAAREAGIAVPRIYDIDEEEGLMVLEYIDGENVSRLLYATDSDLRARIENMIGHDLALLHNAGIAHGDLTTSNLIYKGGRVYFIDFSFATRSAGYEEKGVDIRLLKEVYRSTHPEFEDEFGIIVEGYIDSGGDPKVISKAKEIDSRARYV